MLLLKQGSLDKLISYHSIGISLTSFQALKFPLGQTRFELLFLTHLINTSELGSEGCHRKSPCAGCSIHGNAIPDRAGNATFCVLPKLKHFSPQLQEMLKYSHFQKTECPYL